MARRRSRGWLLLACACGAAARAQEIARVPSGLVVSSTLERLVAAPEGSGAAAQLVPGGGASHSDEVIVSVRFANDSGQIVGSIRITSPVPADVRYVPNSASGPGSDVLFSVDNGLRFGRPDELTVATPDGGKRRAEPAEYTHVRFVLRAPLDAGATGIARYRAVPR